MAISRDGNSILDQVYDALNKHDPVAIAALAAEDVSVDDVPRGRVVTGRRAVEDHYRNFFRAFPDATYNSLRRIIHKDLIVDEWVLRGTNKGELNIGKMVVQPTNKAVELRGVNLFEVRGERVSTQRIYYDLLSFATQLGLTQLLEQRASGQ